MVRLQQASVAVQPEFGPGQAAMPPGTTVPRGLNGEGNGGPHKRLGLGSRGQQGGPCKAKRHIQGKIQKNTQLGLKPQLWLQPHTGLKPRTGLKPHTGLKGCTGLQPSTGLQHRMGLQPRTGL